MFQLCLGVQLIAVLFLGPIAHAQAADLTQPQSLDPVHPQPTDSAKPWDNRRWQALLHIPRSGNTSRVDSKEFFMSKERRPTAQQEWEAAAQAFEQTPQLMCRFPARARVMLALVPTLKLSAPTCTDLVEWKKGLSAESATLVFSSAYAHKPASLFGHTFLRLNSNRKKNPAAASSISVNTLSAAAPSSALTATPASEPPSTPPSAPPAAPSTAGDASRLLDYGINFAASTTGDDNPIAYAYRGLFGGYAGFFSLAPYYTKLNEYVYGESRDLWEYDLKLSREKVDLLVDHLWEVLTSARLDYYYLDENCSFQLLALLEAVEPQWDLTTGFYGYVLPIETVKKLKSQNSLGAPFFRLSLQKMAYNRLLSLTPEAQTLAANVLSHDLALPPRQDAAFYEAINHFLFFQKQKHEGKLSEEDSKLYRASLLARSQVQDAEQPPAAAQSAVQDDDPTLAHGPYAFKIIPLIRKDTRALDLGFRFAIHELLDPHVGYTRFSGVKVLDTRLRLRSTGVALSELTLVEGTSLFPITRFENQVTRNFSWRLYGRFTRSLQNRCTINHTDCLAFQGGGALGLARAVNANSDHILFLMADLRAQKEFDPNPWRLISTLELGGLHTLGSGPHPAKLQNTVKISTEAIGVDSALALNLSTGVQVRPTFKYLTFYGVPNLKALYEGTLEMTLFF